ncbi:hypothetical protein Tco_0718294 [Tanacetum coccineum]|uniref:Uncharacterized protein n=1 Tax=Tanacetum coccineum TaxID=301880 RepID=A0ABQ5BK22_9ASTR
MGQKSKEQDTKKQQSQGMFIFFSAHVVMLYQTIDNEEPMAEVQTTADDNVSATGQQHTEQPESNNEGEVDQNADHLL